MFPPTPTGQPEDDLAVTGNSMRDMLATVSAKTEEDQGPSDDDKLLQRAQDDFRQVVSWEQSYREKAEEELKFVDALDHWDPAMKEERKGRPCLVFDRIGPSIDQVVNDARQNPPEPKVAPIGAGADKDTADVLQGLLRNIDQDSGAVLDEAGQHRFPENRRRQRTAPGHRHLVRRPKEFPRLLPAGSKA